MSSAHHVVFQPQEVLAQGERDVNLDSPVQGCDTDEEALLGLLEAGVRVLVHLIP